MMKSFTYLMLLLCCITILPVNAQKTIDTFINKVPVGVSKQALVNAKHIYIVTSAPIQIKNAPFKRGNLLIYDINPGNVSIDSLLHTPSVLFIQPVRKAADEMVINGSDLSVNNIFYAQDQFPQVTGKGLTVCIKEDRPDTLDIDFKKRFIKTGFESTTLSSHATAMMTLTGGAGNTYYTGRGVAYKANLSSASYQILLPEHDSVYRKFKIGVQNHSYGTGIENYYGADSYAYDASVNNNDTLLHVFSAGNSGNLTSNAGKYSGIAGFANLTGSFKQAKNSLSVGATDSFYNVEPLSSKGPAYDGRIKPELVAFGQDGSSGAAALVSGTTLLLQDVYKQKFGLMPSSALVRSVLINAADDILQAGPDYRSGFGSLNAANAIKTISANQVFQGSANNGSTTEFNISILTNTKQLKITLAWNDIAAMPNAAKALVNDLDIEVVETSTGMIHYPLVLSSFAHTDSLNAIAVERRDTLNTIEQVVLNDPNAGNYTIRIKGRSVQNTQPFAVAYGWQLKDGFEFTYPTKSDNLYPASTNSIRWQSAPTANGILDISYDGGNTWQNISSSAQLSKRYYKTPIKDTITIGRLRMTFATTLGNTTILSDSFTISPRLETSVTLNCVDSFSFYWNKLKGVNNYTVYALTDSFMRNISQVTDTFITIHPNGLKYFAVAPNIITKTGLRSYAFDYSTQGVGCYINSFTADLSGDSVVNMKVILGTKTNVNKVTFQRLHPTTDVSFTNAVTDTIKAVDHLTKDGVYYYRVQLTLSDGRMVISDTTQVIVFRERNLFVYPNPFTNKTPLVVQSKDYSQSVFEIFNIAGQKVFTTKLQSGSEYIHLSFLQKGIYFIRVIQDNKRIFSTKLLVQ